MLHKANNDFASLEHVISYVPHLLSTEANCYSEWVALNVFIALCYYKLDYYDVSLEVLQEYLQHFPDSAVTVNLKVGISLDG